jgi:ferredoxin-like protein FixX
MATIYQLRTFIDIINAVMESSKLQSSDSVSKARIKRDINTIYLNEVCPYYQWKWLRGNIQLTHEATVSTGTATIASNSVNVTLSVAPATSKKGFYFKADGYNEIYKIFQHTANSTSVTLDTPFTGTSVSAGGYRIWTDALPLPVDLRETYEVRHNFLGQPLESVGHQEFRRYVQSGPFAESRPSWYTTSDYVDPVVY